MPIACRPILLGTLCMLGLSYCSKVPGKPKNAGVIDSDTLKALSLKGPVAEGGVGDYYLRNNKLIAIIQKPGYMFGPGPFGGNLIDIAPIDNKIDMLGETMPLFQLGMTIDFEEVRVLNDGSDGAPAVIEASGYDARWNFFNIQTALPGLFRYEEDEHQNPISPVQFDAHADLPIRVVATYTLAENANTVEVRYSISNQSENAVNLWPGFLQDVRGYRETFIPGRGYVDPGVGLDASGLGELANYIDIPYIAYRNEDWVLGFRSRDFLQGGPKNTPRLSLEAAGLVMSIIGIPTLFELFGDPPLIIPGLSSATMGFDYRVAHDIAEVSAWATDLNPSAGTLKGAVLSNTLPVQAARLALIAMDDTPGRIVTSMETNSAGSFEATLAPGRYWIVADHPGHGQDDGREIIIKPGETLEQDITLEEGAEIFVDVVVEHQAQGQGPTPCRVSLYSAYTPRNCGSMACPRVSPFRHAKRFEQAENEPYTKYLLNCDSALDESLKVVPGRYLAVVSHGPEYEIIQQLLEATPGSVVTIAGALRRAVNSQNLVGAELHVHQSVSADSVIALKRRTVALAAAGLDFVATSDHDAIADLRPLVKDLGLDTSLMVVPGVEVTTSGLGHFGAFPIEPDLTVSWGGPPDWAGQTLRPSPNDVINIVRARGAQVVQLNHPRDYNDYFNKIGLRYAFQGKTVALASAPAIPLDPALYFMPSDTNFLTLNYDSMEVFNGITPPAVPLRDWFNFLSIGLNTSITGTSDSHTLYIKPAGFPRTYVQVPEGTLSVDTFADALKAGHVFASNGPILRIKAIANDGTIAGPGEALTLSGAGALTVEVHVETPTWFEVTELEVFMNRVFDDPTQNTTELIANRRWPVTMSSIQQDNGAAAQVADNTIVLSAEELTTLDPGSDNIRDAWLVIRVRGPESSMTPVYTAGATINVDNTANTVTGFAKFTGGQAPFAIAQAIYLDRDENALYSAPFTLVE